MKHKNNKVKDKTGRVMMKGTAIRKILSLVMAFSLIFQQAGFAQGLGQLDIAKFLGQLNTLSGPQNFRPLHLRYFSYNPSTDDFRILLDKGDSKDLKDSQIKAEGQVLLKYFLVGISLPDDNFWVNLRPDSQDKIISPELARTDLGKVLLEADLQLKKDVARFTSPQTQEGREYWNKLYEKAGQIFGSENITIPTLTRPWIVPGEVIIRENANSAYVYKGTLKVMLEQDHLKNSADYNFSDPRLKELNEYSSQLIRDKIIPKLTKEVNSSQRYAALRQAFFSLILSRWFKHKFAGQTGTYPNLINTANLNGLTSQGTWTKTTYFKEYQKSFSKGEYNIKEQVNGIMGPVIRTYFSGGFDATKILPTEHNPGALSFLGGSGVVSDALDNGKGTVAIGGKAGASLATIEKMTAEQAPKLRNEAQKSVSSPITINRVPLIYVEDPAYRGEQISYLLREIDKELANPGTSDLPKIAVIGDTHGDAERFAALLGWGLNKLIGFTGSLDLNISIESQLQKQGLSLKDMKGAIYFNGDILDRGPQGLKVFFMLQELLALAPGKLFFNTGNHDLWAGGNLVGVHLPWRSNKFNFYGDTQAENLWREKTKSEADKFDTPQALLWWTARLAEYNAAQEKFQNEFLEGKAKALREEFLGYYKKYSGNWDNAQLDAMENFMGNFARIDVPDPYVGLRGMGKTSTDRWKSLQQQLLKGHEARRDAGAADDELAVWQKAISLADEITQAVERRSESAKANGDWTYQIFESINNQAYTSVEWWCKDWSSHNEWGEAVIKELNAMLKDQNNTQPLIQKDREEFKGEAVTEANYIRSHTLQSLGEFYRTSANFYLRDPYADLVSHSWFPVEKDGQAVINYKGKTYKGKEVYKGLEAIATDINTNKDPQDAGAAWGEINRWFADTTTIQKPRDEKRYREIGIAKTNSNLGVLNWLTGHNPLNKLGVPFIVNDGEYAHIQIDKGMAARFGREGAIALLGPDGIQFYGFETKGSKEITESPDTIIAAKKEGEAPKVIKNPGMPAKEFLTKTKAALEKELGASSAMTSEVSAAQEAQLYSLADRARWGSPEEQKASFAEIDELAKAGGIYPDSMFDTYAKMAAGEITGFTVGAVNTRTDSIEQLQRNYKLMDELKAIAVSELALSEKVYTGQRPAVYKASNQVAALLARRKGPMFLQADHYQQKREDYAKSPEAARKKQLAEIEEAIVEGDYYGVDLDNSTLVALFQEIVDLEGEAPSEDANKMKEREKKIRTAKDIYNLATLSFTLWEEALGEEVIETIRLKVKEALVSANNEGFYAEIIAETEQKLKEEGLKPDTREGLTKLLSAVQSFKQKIDDPIELDKLSKEILLEQVLNAQETVIGTILSRGKQPKNIMESIGGEIGEVGGKNSEPGEFVGFVELYNAMLNHTVTRIKEGKVEDVYSVIGSQNIWEQNVIEAIKSQERIPGLSKVAIQTGTAHGVGGDIDFRVIRTLAKLGKKYGVVVVQHGASKVAVDKYGDIVINGAGEVHLATLYMEMVIRYLKSQPEGTEAHAIYEDLLDLALKRNFGKAMPAEAIKEHRAKLEQKLLDKIANFRNDLIGVQQRIDALPKEIHKEMGDKYEAVMRKSFINLGMANTLKYVYAAASSAILSSLPQSSRDIFIDRFAAAVAELKGLGGQEAFVEFAAVYDGGQITLVGPADGSQDKKLKDLMKLAQGIEIYVADMPGHRFIFHLNTYIFDTLKSKAGSSPILNPGGIDFRMIPMVTQPMGNFSGLNFSLPRLSHVENINLGEELGQIKSMLKAGITPSGERLKEYVAACYQKGELKLHMDEIIAFLVDTCRLEEEKVAQTSDELKEVLLILDSTS